MIVKMGMKDSHPMLYLLVGISMTIAFFIVRICFFTTAGWYICWVKLDLLLQMPTGFLCVVATGYSIGVFLQYFWFYKIARGLIKLVMKSSKTAKKVA
jgi:hypothetical protein